jgi:hypothetical protein
MADSSVIFYAAMSVFTLGSSISTFILWFFALYSATRFRTVRVWIPLGMNTMMTLFWAAAGFALIPIHLEARDNRDEVSSQIELLANSTISFSGPLSGLPQDEEFNTKFSLWSTAVESSLSAILLGVFLFVAYLAVTILLFIELGNGERDRRPTVRKASKPVNIRTTSRGKVDVFSPGQPRTAEGYSADSHTSWATLETNIYL